MRIVAIIPARYKSSRLPGKALADIAGKPMIQWVWERVSGSALISNVLVATDDKRIFNCVTDFGGHAIMTPENIASGTDRIACVAKDMETDIVINIQGDEPFIESDEVNQVANILIKDPTAVMGTLVKRIEKKEELFDPNIAKVVVDQDGNALYFSRRPIPYNDDSNGHTVGIHDHMFYKHVGIYSYSKDFLLRFSSFGPTPLEKMEKLEQLRALEMGCRVRTEETEFEPIGVDTPADLEKARIHAERKMDTERM